MKNMKIAVDAEPGFMEVPLLKTFIMGGVTLAVHNQIFGKNPVVIDDDLFVVTHLKSGRQIPHTSRMTIAASIHAAKALIKEKGIKRLQAADRNSIELNKIADDGRTN